MLRDATRDELAADLAQAERSRDPIGQLTAAHPEIDVVDAYEIQLINIRQRVAEGARVVGHKVGLSSPIMQQMMGVDEPDYGHLLDDMQVFEDTPVQASRYLSPRVEVEVGFILAADLPGAGCTEDDVLAATEALVPAIELIDTRIKDWQIKICDTIADNASAAGFVLGAARVPPADLDVRAIDAKLTRNGEVVAEGRSDAVLGNPATAVAWLPARSRVSACGCAKATSCYPGHARSRSRRGPATSLSPTSPGWVWSGCRSNKGSNMPSKAKVAIVGSGNISTDLLYKLLRSEWLEPRWMVGIDPESDGLARAAKLGLETTHEGVDWLLAQPDKPDLVFEATSAYVHRDAAPKYAEAGIRAIDLTPAAVGPAVIPPANLREHLDAPNVNMITCGGQATIPIVYAVSRIVEVPYAEIVASVASVSAGPGTRANIDEFTKTTARGVQTIGGAARGKAIIILNPADPPMIMRDTIFCAIPTDADREAIAASIHDVVKEVQTYVPGYRLLNEPQFDEPSINSGGQALVTTFVEVEGAGDYLPPYAGNLDIMTAAATKVGEEIAKETLVVGGAR